MKASSFFFCLLVGLSGFFFSCHLKEVPDDNGPTTILTAEFDYTPKPVGVAPYTATFTNTSKNATTYEWFINGSPISKDKIPSPYKFDLPGSYLIKLVVTNTPLKDIKTDSQKIIVQRITFDTILADFGPIKKVIALPNGEFVMAGTNYITGTANTEGYIIKINAQGVIQPSFTKKFSLGNSINVNDLIQLKSDNSFAICGSVLSLNGTNSDAFYARVNANGAKVIDAVRFGDVNRDGYVQSMVETGNGNIAFCGNRNVLASGNNDIWLSIRDPSNPQIVRSEPSYPGTQSEYGRSITSTDGGFMVFGRVSSTGLTQSFLLKVDANLTQLSGYPKPIGKTTDTNIPQNIISITNNRFALGGTTNPGGGAESKGWLVVTDVAGNTLSSNPVGPTGTKTEILDLIEVGGDFACAGIKGTAAWFVKASAAGSIKAESPFATGGTNAFYAIQATLDGGYILVGEKNRTAYMVRVNAEGKP